MIKNVELKPVIKCLYHMDGTSLEQCELCNMFGGWIENEKGEKTGCDCLRAEVPKLNYMEVMKFECRGKVYERRTYDGLDCEDVCNLCCFAKKIKGHEDKYLCLLTGIDSCGCEFDPFTCIGDNYWVELPDESEDENEQS